MAGSGSRWRAEFSEKGNSGREGQRAALDSVTIEELEAGEARLVEEVPDVLGEVGADGRARDGDACGPFVGEGVDVAEAGVAGVLEVFDDLGWRDERCCDGFGTRSPECGDPDGAGELMPLVREVEVEKALAGAAFAGFAIFQRKERGVADEERG